MAIDRIGPERAAPMRLGRREALIGLLPLGPALAFAPAARAARAAETGEPPAPSMRAAAAGDAMRQPARPAPQVDAASRIEAMPRDDGELPAATARPMLDPEQSRRFRAWMTLLVHAQIEQGPTPRWQQRDCAGLVRFVVAEALREHDLAWRRAMGLLGRRLPPELGLGAPQMEALRHAWRRADGSRGPYVGALELVQENSRFVSRDLAQAQPGDLLFYDLGDDQHLMVWMGRYIAYHTGRSAPGDNGLRALHPAQLLAWRDTRWRPARDNPNFAGLHRLAFVSG